MNDDVTRHLAQTMEHSPNRGFVAQEFIPAWPDKIERLRHNAKVCDVGGMSVDED